MSLLYVSWQCIFVSNRLVEYRSLKQKSISANPSMKTLFCGMHVHDISLTYVRNEHVCYICGLPSDLAVEV